MTLAALLAALPLLAAPVSAGAPAPDAPLAERVTDAAQRARGQEREMDRMRPDLFMLSTRLASARRGPPPPLDRPRHRGPRDWRHGFERRDPFLDMDVRGRLSDLERLARAVRETARLASALREEASAGDASLAGAADELLAEATSLSATASRFERETSSLSFDLRWADYFWEARDCERHGRDAERDAALVKSEAEALSAKLAAPAEAAASEPAPAE